MKQGLIIAFIGNMHGHLVGKKFMERFLVKRGSLLNGSFMAPFTFQGGCNSDVFNTWLEEVLLPALPKGTFLIMDNAAFHKSAKTKELIEKFGCHLLFLPTYSTDLNPIEHCLHKIKSILRTFIQQGYDNLYNLLDASLLT